LSANGGFVIGTIKLVIKVIVWAFWMLFGGIIAFLRYLLSDKFKIVDFVSITLSWIQIYTYVNIVMYTLEMEYLGEGGSSQTIDNASYVHRLYDNYSWYCAINTLLIYVRLFSFFEFNPRLASFTTVLQLAFQDILQFLLLFLFLLVGFSYFAEIQFGDSIFEYRSLFSSMV